MAKYTFVCSNCGTSKQMYVPHLVEQVECSACSNKMNRQMPTLNGPANVREVVDKYTGVTHTDGQLDLIKERREDYYWSVEVPRFVNSGTYSLETMLENDWIFVDDAGKIHINDKPPSKR
jgi:transcription elongation factor Elf1